CRTEPPSRSGHRPRDGEVEAGLELRALGGEFGDRAAGRDAAVEAGDLEAEELRVERGGVGRRAGGADHELAHERGELRIVAREALERRVEVLAQPLGGAAGAGRREVLVGVYLGERRTAAVGQGEAQPEEGALDAGAAVRVGADRRSARAARAIRAAAAARTDRAAHAAPASTPTR